ncbi:MAG TPA: hypothetical protein VH302_15160, partial [Bryobacteraceae bacterium]|nr:hypothetical protein [Bryobacteraceae bacterium]
VQIVVDCHWRLRRIQELEEAFYARGHEQFEEQFAGMPLALRRSRIVLETHLAYQKELRNLHIQEARIDRKRRKALEELKQLQSGRQTTDDPAAASDSDPFKSDAEFFAAINAGYIPPFIAENLARQQRANGGNGFEFSSASLPEESDGAIARYLAEHPTTSRMLEESGRR